jgi:hypothetical protein
MKRFVLLTSLALTLNACFLFPKYQQQQFVYRQGGSERVQTVLVPRGYSSVIRESDSLGNTLWQYRYRQGRFFVAYLADTAYQSRWFYHDEQQPHRSRQGDALVYKGMDHPQLFWREVHRGGLRIGYHGVEPRQEYRFDSATNYAIRMEIK